VFGGTLVTLTVTGGTSCTAPGLETITQYPDGYVNIKVLTPNNEETTIPIIVTGDTPDDASQLFIKSRPCKRRLFLCG
jgi:hypothetical protein